MEGKIKVFLADPSALVLRVLQRELEALGEVEVVGTATDGQRALSALRETTPDVLLTDVFLPGLDGFALAEAAGGAGSEFPAIFLSAYSGAGLTARAKSCGGSLLPKPCGVHHILRHIHNTVRGEVLADKTANSADTGTAADTEAAEAAARKRAADDAIAAAGALLAGGLDAEEYAASAAHAAGRPRHGTNAAIAAALAAFGIPDRLIGYDYLATALRCITSDRTLLDGVTKKLYPEVARQYSATASGVERAMRSAIEKAWKPHNEPRRRAFFGRAFACSARTPTNARFLAKMAKAVEAKLTEWENDPPSDPRRFAWLWM